VNTVGDAEQREPRAVVLVGAGARAQAWLAALRRSARLRLVGTVGRHGGGLAPGLPYYATLEDAMREHPGAAFAVALPPRAAAEGALQLAAGGRTAVVEAPLHDSIADARLAPEADAVRVAHGWVTLRGVRPMQQVIERARAGRLHVDIAGLPESDSGDPDEVLVHAVALIRALLPRAAAASARHVDGGTLEVDFNTTGGHWTAHLRARTRGQHLAVHIENAGEPAHWSWQPDCETAAVGRRQLLASEQPAPGEVRALAQLLSSAPCGDSLADAATALRMVRNCRALLPRRLPLGERAFRQSAAIAQRRPLDVLDRLGLRGTLPEAPGPPPARLDIVRLDEPFELWAFRAGVKPVAFLTVRPDTVERALAGFGDVHCVRRERRVEIGSQDRWTDRRDQGEARIELYIARERELAERAAHWQAEGDPTRSVKELGALFGYPPCCIDAFARQDDRANNSRNRYYGHARTLAPDGTTRPWPWELNNLHTLIVPFYPCTYRCQMALGWARAALAALAREHPPVADALHAALARPVLYFDHDHQLAFDGEWTGAGIAYRTVALAPGSSAPLADLAAAIARGNRLIFDDRALVVERDGQTVCHLERTDPALGFIAPFA
jgi:hypothetical protein